MNPSETFKEFEGRLRKALEVELSGGPSNTEPARASGSTTSTTQPSGVSDSARNAPAAPLAPQKGSQHPTANVAQYGVLVNPSAHPAQPAPIPPNPAANSPNSGQTTTVRELSLPLSGAVIRTTVFDSSTAGTHRYAGHGAAQPNPLVLGLSGTTIMPTTLSPAPIPRRRPRGSASARSSSQAPGALPRQSNQDATSRGTQVTPAVEDFASPAQPAEPPQPRQERQGQYVASASAKTVPAESVSPRGSEAPPQAFRPREEEQGEDATFVDLEIPPAAVESPTTLEPLRSPPRPHHEVQLYGVPSDAQRIAPTAATTPTSFSSLAQNRGLEQQAPNQPWVNRGFSDEEIAAFRAQLSPSPDDEDARPDDQEIDPEGEYEMESEEDQGSGE